MTNTVAYRAYKRENFDQREVVQQEGPDSVTFSASSISSFYLPVSVNLNLTPSGSVTFVFAYPNDEPAEDYPRPHPKRSSVLFVLGKRTRKILEVRFSEGRRRIDNGHRLSFPRDGVAVWGSGLDDYKRHSFEANVRVIHEILESLPSEFYQQLKDELAAGPPWLRGASQDEFSDK